MKPIVTISDTERKLTARIAELEKLSVTNIMLNVVPGYDGEGVEIYAKSVADVEDALSRLGSELEDWQLGIKQHYYFTEKIKELEAELAAQKQFRGLAVEHANVQANEALRAASNHTLSIIKPLQGTSK